MILYSRKKHLQSGRAVYLSMIQVLKWGVRFYKQKDGVTHITAYYFNPIRQIKQMILESHAKWAMERLEQTKGKRWNPID